MLSSDAYKEEFAKQIGIKDGRKGLLKMFNRSIDDDTQKQISEQFVKGFVPSNSEVSPEYFEEQYCEFIAGMNKEQPTNYPEPSDSGYDFETTPDFDTSW